MKAKYDAYNSWVSFFIVTCETLITGGLFYLLFLTTEEIQEGLWWEETFCPKV
ncbi:hypothetical protein [Phocaeicola plebeius]|uniref:hypothetical protein n=1 Tax=Phocaeicola plebeius TaxID=310297 RepID=UPI0026ED0876|nr:hypothetical protein [Phocaeicola plebeius]